MMPHVCGPSHYLPVQLLLAQASADHSDGWTALTANAAADAAQTAAKAAVIAATAAAQAAIAASMTRMDVGFKGSHCRAPASFPPWRKAHGGAKEWQTLGSASKSRHVNSKNWYQWKAQLSGDAKSGQGVGRGKAKDGQLRRDPRRRYRLQEPKGKRSNQKQRRFQAGRAGLSRFTQTSSDKGLHTVSLHSSKDGDFNAAEEITKGYVKNEPELSQIFLRTGNGSDDSKDDFLPSGSKSLWPQLDGSTTVSSVGGTDSFSQDSNQDRTMSEDQPEDDTKEKLAMQGCNQNWHAGQCDFSGLGMSPLGRSHLRRGRVLRLELYLPKAEASGSSKIRNSGGCGVALLSFTQHCQLPNA